LHDALEMIFHRVFDSDYLYVRRMDFFQERIQGRRLSGTGRAGRKEHAVRARDFFLETREELRMDAEILEPYLYRLGIEYAQHERLAVVPGNEGCADFHFAPAHVYGESSVLRAVVHVQFESGKEFQA